MMGIIESWYSRRAPGFDRHGVAKLYSVRAERAARGRELPLKIYRICRELQHGEIDLANMRAMIQQFGTAQQAWGKPLNELVPE